MFKLNLLIASSFSLILFAASFCKDLFYAYGVSPTHEGELDAYLPLFRVLLTLVVSHFFLQNRITQVMLSTFQIVVTFLCYNAENLSFISELLEKQVVWGLDKETYLVLLESIPIICLWALIAYVDYENKPVSWEPAMPNPTDMSERIDEVKEAFRATAKEKIHSAQKVMGEQKLEFENSVKRKIKEAEKFYDEHQKEIEHSLVPDALSEKTISVVEEDDMSVSSIDSSPPKKPTTPSVQKKTKTQLAREEAYRKQQERVKKRLSQLRSK